MRIVRKLGTSRGNILSTSGELLEANVFIEDEDDCLCQICHSGNEACYHNSEELLAIHLEKGEEA